MDKKLQTRVKCRNPCIKLRQIIKSLLDVHLFGPLEFVFVSLYKINMQNFN